MKETSASPTLAASARLTEALGYCGVDAATRTAGAPMALTGGEPSLGAVTLAGRLAESLPGRGARPGQLTIPKPM